MKEVANMTIKMEEFDELVDQTAMSTMELVLGGGTAKALIHHMGAKASEAGGRPFSEDLRRITGGGAVIMEKLIVRALYGKLGLGPEEDQGEFSFERSVSRAHDLMVSGGKAS